MDSVTPTFFVKFMSGTLKESVPNFRKIHEVGIAQSHYLKDLNSASDNVVQYMFLVIISSES